MAQRPTIPYLGLMLEFRIFHILGMCYDNVSNITNTPEWVTHNGTKLTKSHTKYKKLRLQRASLVLLPDKFRSVRFVTRWISEKKKKNNGISELLEFQNCTWTIKSSETRGIGNYGSRWLNKEKCFPLQNPSHKL